AFFFFFQADDGIRDFHVTGVQTCALPISVALAERVDRPSVALGRQLVRRQRREPARDVGAQGGGACPVDIEPRLPAEQRERCKRSEERRVGKGGRRWRWR